MQKSYNLHLDANAVILPLQEVLKECSESVMFGLIALEMLNEIPNNPFIKDGFFRMKIGEDNRELHAKKEQFRKWLIKKGIEELNKGVEYSLREAYLYLSIYHRYMSTTSDANAFLNTLNKIRNNILRLPIPTMIDKIESSLNKPLRYKKEIQ